MVHVIGIDPEDSSGLQDYHGDRDGAGQGSGMFDHVAFFCNDLVGMRASFALRQLAFRERTVHNLSLHQILLTDPNGITVELKFPEA